MKRDMTLLEKDSAPTIAELKAFFRDHDFSTQVSKYDPMVATDEQNRVYIKAKKYGSDPRKSDAGRRRSNQREYGAVRTGSCHRQNTHKKKTWGGQKFGKA